MGEPAQERQLSTKRMQANLAARLRSDGKTWGEIATVFRKRYGVNGRVALRLAHQLSQKDVAEAWNSRWPDDPKSFKNISYWEQWPSSTGHQPSLVVLRCLAEIYACSVSDLVADYADFRHLDTACGMANSQMPRTSAMLSTRVPALDQSVNVPLPATRAENVPAGNSRSDRAVMEGFRVADRQVGGGHLYPAVLGYLQTTISPRLLDAANHSDDEAIFTSASALSEMAGWMAHDAGKDDRAKRHFRRSLELATLGNDLQLKAHILASLSHLSLHNGDPGDAIRLAQEGRAILEAGPSNADLLARLFSMEARGYAALHKPYQCDESLEFAAEALEGRRTDQSSPWISEFDAGSLSSEVARCMGLLCRYGEAEYHARRIISLRTADRARSRAFGQLLLARVLIAQDEPEEACAVAREVLGATHSLGSYIVLRRLGDLRNNLGAFSDNNTVSALLAELSNTLDARLGVYQITGDIALSKEGGR